MTLGSPAYFALAQPSRVAVHAQGLREPYNAVCCKDQASTIDIQLVRLTPTPEMSRIGRMNIDLRLWSLRNHYFPSRGATLEPSPAFLKPGWRATPDSVAERRLILPL